KAIYGLEVPNLTGGVAKMLPNHHITKPVLIGEIMDNGQFQIVSQTEEVPGDAWTDYLPESAKIVADWLDPKINCGNYNTLTKMRAGQNYRGGRRNKRRALFLSPNGERESYTPLAKPTTFNQPARLTPPAIPGGALFKPTIMALDPPL